MFDRLTRAEKVFCVISQAAKGLYLEVGYIQSFFVISGTLRYTEQETA